MDKIDTKNLKKLRKQYKSMLSKYSRYFYIQRNSLNYFIVYLHYLRDVAILSTSKKEFETSSQIATLIFAIEEYERASDCINKYYYMKANCLCRRDQNVSAEETQQQYQKERNMHMASFCQAVQYNLLDWIDNYGN